jgi:hypothetical protein
MRCVSFGRAGTYLVLLLLDIIRFLGRYHVAVHESRALLVRSFFFIFITILQFWSKSPCICLLDAAAMWSGGSWISIRRFISLSMISLLLDTPLIAAFFWVLHTC